MSEVRRVRRWRSATEKRQIVQLTMEPGASVSEVARDHGVNANQVFKWRRAWERGELTDGYAALLPVSVSSPLEPESKASAASEPELVSDRGSIHIELHGSALISIERGADPEMVRCILQSVGK
ncbi:MAG: transposase [Acidobacteria bacterium]|nr:transposase [Acidobacteriota bacterium]